MLDAAVHRPQASVLGQDPLPVFCAKNDVALDPDDDAAYERVIAVASGAVDDVGEIAAVLASFARDCGA